ncbi:hypothetical protein KDA82_38845, partial [Streptomyces daliensis]|nr:hypothetical protein [Streptomyces daliensis]
MGGYAKRAAEAAHDQLADTLGLGEKAAWKTLAVTAMAGVNDVEGETFTLADGPSCGRSPTSGTSAGCPCGRPSVIRSARATPPRRRRRTRAVVSNSAPAPSPPRRRADPAYADEMGDVVG